MNNNHYPTTRSRKYYWNPIENNVLIKCWVLSLGTEQNFLPATLN